MSAAPSQPVRRASTQTRRLQLSGLIDDRIEWVTARERQRAWLVNTVVLAQALITFMVAPGYVFPSVNLAVLLTLAVAIVFYAAAFLFNTWRRELRVAVYMLIGGGALATAAQVFVIALLSHDSAHTAQAALLFLPIVLEAGLFLTPELTLLVASAAAVFTASAILLALALSSDSGNQLSQAYLVMVYALGLEAFIGYLAWRLAQFIYETVKSAQADEDLRFAQARLAATQRQMADQRRQLIQDVSGIQLAVSSALSNEYDMRIEVTEGDLAPLAASLDLVIQQLRSTNELERRLRKMESETVLLIESVSRLASGAAPVPGAEMPTDTPLYAVQAALKQAQVIIARRQARLQEVAAEVATTVKHGREGFANASSESGKAQQLAGQLVSLAESLMQTAQRQADLLAQARRSLALVLPAELTQDVPSAAEGSGSSGLEGLSRDIGISGGDTSDFPILEPSPSDTVGISPLTTPLPAVNALAASNEDAASAFSDGTLPAGLADAWLALTQLQAQTANETRSAASLFYDMGVLGRYVRTTIAGIDWVNQSLNIIESDAERIQQLAGASGLAADLSDDMGMVGATGMTATARPAPSSTPRHAPVVTRPLEANARLSIDLGIGSPSQPLESGAGAQESPTPGSLRVSDLIGFDVLGSQGGEPMTPQQSGSSNDSPEDSDSQRR